MNPKLTAAQVRLLREVSAKGTMHVAPYYRPGGILLSMGLIIMVKGDRVQITELGKQRLKEYDSR
jgi:hypothetical protein